MEYSIKTEFRSHLDYKTLLLEFKKIIRDGGLKFTKQREYILRELYISETHITPEELHYKMQSYQIPLNSTKIGIVTIYRTLSLLENRGFVTTIISEKDAKRYELASKSHHDHIICQKCKKIVEFSNDEVENIQNNIANSLGFKVVGHSMQIFGICKDCQENH